MKKLDLGPLELLETITIRVTEADMDRLRILTESFPLVKKAAIAREAFRRGMGMMEDEIVGGDA